MKNGTARPGIRRSHFIFHHWVRPRPHRWITNTTYEEPLLGRNSRFILLSQPASILGRIMYMSRSPIQALQSRERMQMWLSEFPVKRSTMTHASNRNAVRSRSLVRTDFSRRYIPFCESQYCVSWPINAISGNALQIKAFCII